MRKAQGSIEGLIIAGVGLAILVAIALVVSNNFGGLSSVSSTETSQAALSDLSNAGSKVYQEGPGSKSIAVVNLPSDVASITFNGRTMRINYNSGKSEIKNVDYPVYGSVDASPGLQEIPVVSTVNGVCFGEQTICISCADGVIDHGEQCDDSNTQGGDGCSSICQIEPLPSCGDGYVNSVTEQCDDGNNNDGDGCNSICVIETPDEYCGDGSLNQANETCDDGNNINLDGCSAICIEEVATPICGDTLINQPSEECDDGNAVQFDGCSPTCLIENDLSYITMCLVITDARGNITVASSRPNTTIVINNSVPGYTTCGAPTIELPNNTFITPITLNADLFGDDGIKDGVCNTFYGLEEGNYYYSNVMTSSGQWQTSLYNDQYSQVAINTSYFYNFDASCYDHIGGNDGPRNRNADGEIILVEERSQRTLIVLARYPYVCGDSVLNQANETCDDGNVQDGDGCSSICRIEGCGSGIKDANETCDGSDFGGATCNTYGFSQGSLSCNPACTSISTSGCSNPQAHCLYVNTTGYSLQNSDQRIVGLKAKNICPSRTINIIGANITWGNSADLRIVNLTSNAKWSYNCAWNCTPSGDQNTNTKVYFKQGNTSQHTLTPGQSVNIERIEWDNDIDGTSIRVGLILNDSSQNRSAAFTP